MSPELTSQQHWKKSQKREGHATWRFGAFDGAFLSLFSDFFLLRAPCFF
jgi:hypothetical protein